MQTQPKATTAAARQPTATLSGPAEKEKILKDIANMKSELDSLRAKLHDRRKLQGSTTAALASKTPMSNDVKQLQSRCQQQEASISELKEQLEHVSASDISIETWHIVI